MLANASCNRIEMTGLRPALVAFQVRERECLIISVIISTENPMITAHYEHFLSYALG